jgi:mono/diheme cytochrome c family protein
MAVHKFLPLLAVVALIFCSTFSAAEGAAATYKAKCAMCHGADGKGDTPMAKKMGAHDFASQEVQSQSDAQLAEIIAKGKNKMPGYEKSMKESEIKDLVAYVRELGKKK